MSFGRFRPQKGVRPPQFEGKRTGRPKGSRNLASALREMLWGYEHWNDDAAPPSGGAALWRKFARMSWENRVGMMKLLVLHRLHEPALQGA